MSDLVTDHHIMEKNMADPIPVTDPLSTSFYVHIGFQDGIAVYVGPIPETAAHGITNGLGVVPSVNCLYMHNGYGDLQVIKGVINGKKAPTV